MPTESNGPRTHEPDLRELTAQVDAVKELLVEKNGAIRDLLDERDRRTTEQFESQKAAVNAALAAQDKLTQAAFASAEKAIDKAEANQTVLNAKGNEFRGQLDDQAKTLMTRNEFISQHESLRLALEVVRTSISVLKDDMRKEMSTLKDDLRKEAQIQKDDLKKELDNLRSSRDTGVGHQSGVVDSKQGFKDTWGYVFGVLGLLIAAIAMIVKLK